MVRRAVTLLMVVASLVSGYNYNNEYCAELNPQPQPQVDIEQIMGMWYGIEIISHNADAKHEVVYEEGCPIVYFAEDRTPISTTLYPDYKRIFDRTRYDERHYETTPPPDQEPYWYTTPNTLYGVQYENYQKRRQQEDIKRLRIMWDDTGSSVEYNVRYNVSQAGFWITSGPQNGSVLDAKFNHFAGTIQVLKAVGNHLVLVFCNRLPAPQLFTVLLSRVQNLNQAEVYGVHNMLIRRGLSTASVKKVCTATDSSASIGFNLALLIVVQIAVFLAA